MTLNCPALRLSDTLYPSGFFLGVRTSSHPNQWLAIFGLNILLILLRGSHRPLTLCHPLVSWEVQPHLECQLTSCGLEVPPWCIYFPHHLDKNKSWSIGFVKEGGGGRRWPWWHTGSNCWEGHELAHAGDVVKHTNLLLEKEAHEEGPWESLLSAQTSPSPG